jgi:hypothetical protein
LGSNAVKYTAAGSVVIIISAERIPSSSSSSYYSAKHTYQSHTGHSNNTGNAGATATQYDIESQLLKQQQQHGRLEGQRWRRSVLHLHTHDSGATICYASYYCVYSVRVCTDVLSTCMLT